MKAKKPAPIDKMSPMKGKDLKPMKKIANISSFKSKRAKQMSAIKDKMDGKEGESMPDKRKV